jgi:hypothetical protein
MGTVTNTSNLLETGSVCLSGFAPGQPVSVVVEGPEGAMDEVPGVIGENGSATLEWLSSVGFPLGTYTVTASQGEDQATDTFDLRDATHPVSRVVPSVGPPDAGFEMVFYKFPAGDDLSLYLYHVDAEGTEGEGFEAEHYATYGYLATLTPSVLTDGEGTLIFPIEGASLSEGGYCIFYAEPEDTSLSHGCIRFDVES